MKKSLILAGVITGLSLWMGSAPSAQAQSQPPRGTVAIIDLSKIFKDHVRFKQAKEGLRTRVELAEKTLSGERDQLEKMKDQLKTYKSGSPEYKQLEERMAKGGGDLQARIALQKKGFLEDEAKIYFNTYAEIKTETANFARKYGFTLVLRYNSDDMDGERLDPQEIIRGLNRQVVFNEPSLDITPYVLQLLNSGVGPTPPPQPRPNPGQADNRNKTVPSVPGPNRK